MVAYFNKKRIIPELDKEKKPYNAHPHTLSALSNQIQCSISFFLVQYAFFSNLATNFLQSFDLLFAPFTMDSLVRIFASALSARRTLTRSVIQPSFSSCYHCAYSFVQRIEPLSNTRKNWYLDGGGPIKWKINK